MNLSATSAPHSSNEAPAACGAPGSATLPSPSGETTTVSSAPASSPASSPGTTASHSPAQASTLLTSTATIPTQRAARYGKQLVSHMAHKITGFWDEEEGIGYLLFDHEGPVLGRFDVIASPSDLRLELRTTPERAAHLERVAGIHLARFGARDGLTIAWRRSDGSEGSVQGPLTPDEVEARARERAKRKAAGQ